MNTTTTAQNLTAGTRVQIPSGEVFTVYGTTEERRRNGRFVLVTFEEIAPTGKRYRSTYRRDAQVPTVTTAAQRIAADEAAAAILDEIPAEPTAADEETAKRDAEYLWGQFTAAQDRFEAARAAHGITAETDELNDQAEAIHQQHEHAARTLRAIRARRGANHATAADRDGIHFR